MTAHTSVKGRRPRALAEIGFNAISDTATSSDDELQSQAHHVEQDDAQYLVGVSLGPEQTRLTSPTTPAVDKVAAIEAGGGFFWSDASDASDEQEDGAETGVNTVDGHGSDNLGGRTSQRPRHRAPPEPRLPSPWRATPRLFQTDGEHGRTNRTINFSRPRALTGSFLSGGWQKVVSPNLPSFPRSLPFAAQFSGKKAISTSTSPLTPTSPRRAQTGLPHDENTSGIRGRRGSDAASAAAGTEHPARAPDTRQYSTAPAPLLTRPSYLRRTASDESPQLMSALSRASTLGDDSRFEDVKEQVNSRAKAIRDSFQDSNIKLPSLPSFTNLSLGSFRPDFTFVNRSSNSARQSSTDLLDREPSPTPSQTARNMKTVGDTKAGGPTAKAATSHPHFTKACAEMTGDLVILGGYRGSVLRSADPPHRQLWVPVKVGLNIRKVDMEVGLNVPEDDKNMESKIIPAGMLSHIGPVDISRRLFRRLCACDNAKSGQLRIHDYGYDWRLDPDFLSQKLIDFLEKLPCNRPQAPRSERGATVIAHSLGGLITRHAVNKRPDLFAGVVYAGTPMTCCNILGPLRNGDDVLLSSRVLTAQVNFTIRTSFALLPLDGKCFFNKDTKEEFPVDFFDPQSWIDYRLTPCLARPVPVAEPTRKYDGFMSTMSSRFSGISLSKMPDSSDGRNGESKPDQGHSSVLSGGSQLEPSDMDHAPSSSVATAVTIPRDQALAYLTTVLARVKKFKQELVFQPEHRANNIYPPAAVIYGKSVPTVYGANVKDRGSIKQSDAFDQLAFASGDGVVLARSAMLPEGYQVVSGGVVSSERGHITLLGDLEAVGRALNAIRRSRIKGGVGTGLNL